jgi:hypothetical protein
MAYIGKQPVVGNFQKCDAISVVNGQAAYTLQVGGTNVVPESVNHMLVSLNGILQAPTDSFTVSGSTLTFASNLATGDVIDFVMILGNVLDLGVPSDNTVTAAKLNNDIISGQTALASEPADTDEFLVSDAGVLKRIDYSLIKGGGGLIHLQTQNITSGVSSVDFTSGIDGTYNAYQLMISDLKTASDDVQIFIRTGDPTEGGFYSNNYGRASIGRDSAGSTQVASGNGSGNLGVNITIPNLGNASDECLNATAYIGKTTQTDTHKLIYGQASYVQSNGGFNLSNFCGGQQNQVRAIDRIQVIASSGNIDRGNFTLFGVANS